MATFFLIVIYIAFIGLGLPDSLLGTAWPAMRLSMGATLDSAGIISFLISGSTIISSLLCSKLTTRLGAGKVTLFSVGFTAIALLGFSFSGAFGWLILFAIPLGLGAGAVDSALNNYVALHYKASHMNWLHSFWGIGAFIGPLIMGYFMRENGNWQGGYRAVSILQFGIVVLLFLTLPLWKKEKEESTASIPVGTSATKASTSILKISGVPFALLLFLFYCAIEGVVALWGSSFLVEMRGFTAANAATVLSLYYLGITLGRILSGFLSTKLNTKQLIYIGMSALFCGIVILLFPLPAIFSYIAFSIVGLGCAPIFPNMLHETPHSFGSKHSQKIVSYQMACAYCGSTFLPPVVGLLTTATSLIIIPFILLVFCIFIFILFYKLNYSIATKY